MSMLAPTTKINSGRNKRKFKGYCLKSEKGKKDHGESLPNVLDRVGCFSSSTSFFCQILSKNPNHSPSNYPKG